MNWPFMPMYSVAFRLFWEEVEVLLSAPIMSSSEAAPLPAALPAELEAAELEEALPWLPDWALFPPRPRLEQEVRASKRAPAQVMANIRFIFCSPFLDAAPPGAEGRAGDRLLAFPPAGAIISDRREEIVDGV